MIELLRARRSIREYAGRTIEPEKVELLKEAVLRAPSSRNIDPWEFIFVDDRDLLAKLAQCKPHGADFLEQASKVRTNKYTDEGKPDGSEGPSG